MRSCSKPTNPPARKAALAALPNTTTLKTPMVANGSECVNVVGCKKVAPSFGDVPSLAVTHKDFRSYGFCPLL